MRSRFVPISIAAAVAASALIAPPSLAQESYGQPITRNVTEQVTKDRSIFNNPFALPSKQPQDVVLQVAATQDSVNLNWITAADVTGQSVRIREVGADSSKVVEATSATSEVYLTEGYKDAKPNYYTNVANHKATVTGLKENTKYVYSVGSDQDGWSSEYEFNTGTYGDAWNFLVFGDPQLYSSRANGEFQQQIASWDNTLSTAVEKYPNTSFLLSAGDQANYSALQEHSGFISPDEMRQYRAAVNNGNHDEVDFGTYQAMYNRPNVQEDGRNYWFEYNNALVISLDTNHWRDFDEDVEFLRKTVAEHREGKDWVVVTYHHATFSQAYHMQDTVNQYYRERMTPIFSELDVDLVLSGHDHIYTRSYLMDGPTPVDFGREVKLGETVEKKKGEVQYVTANSSSGSKYYNFYDFKTQTREENDEKNPWNFENSIEGKTIRTYTAVWAQEKNPNYTNVDVTGESLTVTTYDVVTNEKVDEFTLTRAAEDKPADTTDQDQSGSATGSADNGEGSSVGAALGVLALLLAALGGGAFWALQQGMVPAQLAALLPQF